MWPFSTAVPSVFIHDESPFIVYRMMHSSSRHLIIAVKADYCYVPAVDECRGALGEYSYQSEGTLVRATVVVGHGLMAAASKNIVYRIHISDMYALCRNAEER